MPEILPFVFYHGRSKWPYEPFFASVNAKLLAKSDILPLNFEYILHDLSQIPDDEIKGTILLKVVQHALKYIHQPKKLFEKIEFLLNLLQKDTGLQYIESLLRYVFEQVDREYRKRLVNIAEHVILDGGNIMITIAQELRNEGKIEGIEGMLKIKFKNEGISLMPDISQISDLDKLNQIMDLIEKSESIDEIKKVLH